MSEINLKEYLSQAAAVLRSSERMVQRNVEIWRQTPERDGEMYDPDWDVHLEQNEVAGLLSNLKDAAHLFQVLAENRDAAVDLVKAHDAAEGGGA